jgi:thymidylate synthase
VSEPGRPDRCAMGQTADSQYGTLIADVLSAGDEIRTRNSVVRRLFARTARFAEAPLVSARRTAWRSALREMEWFLSGSWADSGGRVRNNYGRMFRHSHGAAGVVDQIALLLEGVRAHPSSRRNVITTWNTADMVAPETPITNCHGTVIQAFVDAGGGLHLVTYQRSADAVCGLPHNWIQYWAFLLWLAARSGRGVGSLTWVGGDVHVYREHWGLAGRIVAAAGTRRSPGLRYEPSSPEFRADDFALAGDYAPALTDRAVLVL